MFVSETSKHVFGFFCECVRIEKNMDSNTESFLNDDILKDVKLRKISCSLNQLTRSDGSTMFAQGETAVAASVSGPVEVRLQNLQVEKASVEVEYRSKSGQPTDEDAFREKMIRDTCESTLITSLHPRTAIKIQIQELENKGGLLACALNAAQLAILICGLATNYMIAAINCIIDKNNELILDPDNIQSANAKATFLFTFDSTKEGIVSMYNVGNHTIPQFKDALTLCRAASYKIFDFYKNEMAKFHKTN